MVSLYRLGVHVLKQSLDAQMLRKHLNSTRMDMMAAVILTTHGCFQSRGTPKWMVYNGIPYQNGWFGVPLFSETSTSKSWILVQVLYSLTAKHQNFCRGKKNRPGSDTSLHAICGQSTVEIPSSAGHLCHSYFSASTSLKSRRASTEIILSQTSAISILYSFPFRNLYLRILRNYDLHSQNTGK